MMTLEKALKHMAWSNQLFFDEVAKLPESVYGLRAAEGEWPVGKLLNHLLNAGEWFRYCLTKEPWTNLERIQSHEILLKYKPYLAELDALLLSEAAKDDVLKEFADENGPHKAHASTIITQAIMHTTEHKAQIATVLKQHGHHIDLDALDVWRYTNE